jgi:iron complex outermembrane receptor protein
VQLAVFWFDIRRGHKKPQRRGPKRGGVGTRVIWTAIRGCIALACVAYSSPLAAQVRQFDIPSEDAGKSIEELARQAGVSILAPGERLRRVITPAVKGNYDVIAALELMLKGTDLVVSRSAEGTIMVSLRQPEKQQEREMSPSLKRSTSVMALLLGFLAGNSANAQDVSPLSGNSQNASEIPVESVVVTGSRVISDVSRSPTPLTAISNEQLLQTTPTSIADALLKLPAFEGSLSPRSAGGSGTMAGMNVLNLRNFGQNRTLVLLDGHRVTPSNADGSVSVDTLPLALMSRVDVVTGGASAVYGSDAVSGVVNFILDKNFNGFKADVNGGISTYGDGGSFKLDAAAGTSLFDGRGHIEVAVSSLRKDPVAMFARPYGRQVWVQTGQGTVANPFTNNINARRPTAPFGGRVTCTGCSVNGFEFSGNGVLTPFVDGTTTGTGNVSSGGDGGYNKYGTALNGLRNNSAFGRFSYDLGDNTTFYVNASASELFSNGWWFPVKIGPGNTGAFFKSNPFLPAAVQTQLGNNGLSDATNRFSVGQFVDQGPGAEAGTRGVNRLLSVTTGLDGVWRDFAWNVYYTHGEDRQALDSLFDQNYQNMFAAQDAVTAANGTVQCYAATQAATASRYAGCVPLNPFGPTATTPAAMQWMTAETWYHMTNVMDNLGGGVSGPLFDTWAGPVNAALSAEARFNDMTVLSNADTGKVDCTGLRICDPNQAHWAGGVANMHASNNVWEVALEADVPLLKDLPLAQSLNVNLAGRYTDYSTSGSVETWKIGIDYHVNNTVRFRGTASVDIRAPNLNDLFQPQSATAGSGYFDFHTNTQGVTSVVSGGNPNLKPEVAHTYTAGVVLTPDFLPGFTTSFDFYQVHLSNAIGQISGVNISTQQLCEASGGTSNYCSLYVRPLAFSNTTPANYPTTVFSQSLNTAVVQIQGFDLEANYAFEWLGNWTARMLATYQPVNQSQGFPGAPFTFTQVPPNNDLLAKTHVTGFLSYNVEGWTVGLQDRWIGGHSKKTTVSPTIAQVYTQPHVRSSNYLDVNLQRDFAAGGVDLTGYFNVQNVFNNKGQVYLNSAVQGIFYPVSPEDDIMGRYFTLGMRVKF